MSKTKPRRTGRKKQPRGKNASLTWKLNLHFFGQLFAAFLAVDLLLLAVVCGGVWLRTEQRVSQIVEAVEAEGVPAQSGVLSAAGYTVTLSGEQPEGVRLPNVWTAWLPENTRDGARTLTWSERANLGGLLWVTATGERTAYTVQVETEQGTLSVTADLEEAASRASFLVLVVLVGELACLVSSLFDNRRAIRKGLEPIRALTETANTLNADMSPKELARLAGKLDQIDTAHLDTRISASGGQKELKALATAINAMLERIDQGYKAQARFVSDASHELRTPIAVIQGYANLLDRWGKDDPETRQEAITAIRSEAEAMKVLVEQLLFLARGDNDSMQVRMELLDLSALADEVFQETELIDKDHRLDAQVAQGIFVTADDGLMKQAVRVVVDNALKYTPAGGRVGLTLAASDGIARLTVSDEGQGIPPESLPHIFERFYRTDESRARQTGGTGLGLAIAKYIIDRHGGWIEVVSRVNAGTHMTLCLPVTELPPQEEGERAE